MEFERFLAVSRALDRADAAALREKFGLGDR
jgi:hypothetical protein